MSTIQLIQGSAVEQTADAIVNAANRQLAAGGGICGAIFAKAGYAPLEHACAQYRTPLRDGEAVITPAFGIKNAHSIIHAVGPNFFVTPGAYKPLQQAYYRSLEVLMQNNLHSIAFPLISSGIFGGNLKNPATVSARACVQAYRAFTQAHPAYQIDVRLCAFSLREYSAARMVFEEAAEH